ASGSTRATRPSRRPSSPRSPAPASRPPRASPRRGPRPRPRPRRKRPPPRGSPRRRRSAADPLTGRAGEQLVELAGAIERRDVVVAADRFSVDEDLRHGRASGDLGEPVALGAVPGAVDVLERDAL